MSLAVMATAAIVDEFESDGLTCVFVPVAASMRLKCQHSLMVVESGADDA